MDLPVSSKPDVIKCILEEFLPGARAPPPITTATDNHSCAPLTKPCYRMICS